MSLLEQKRLQWAAERAQLSEWDPWGRPGCGAPVGGPSIVPQQQMTLWQRESPKPMDISIPLHISCGPNDLSGPLVRTKLPPLPISSGSPPQQRLSSSLVSNNNPFMYTYAYDMWKEEAKKHWLQELNKQRDEQRLKRVHVSLPRQVLNDLSSVPIQVQVPIEVPSTLPEPNSFVSTHSPSPSNFDSSASTPHWPNKTFLRGANVPVDLVTHTQMSLKRAKALEQQEAIRLQIEERKKVREREKAEEKRREMMEELRLTRERQDPSSNHSHNDVDHKAGLSVAKPSLPDVLDGAFTNIIKPAEKPVNAEIVECDKSVAMETLDYVVNRVLTPTKYRGLAVISRDFATQTGPIDLYTM